MSKTKAVATVKEETNLPAVPMAAWGAEEITGKDILLSKMMVMQPLAIKVLAGEADPGQIIDSVNGTVLGDIKTPVEVVPISVYKTWKIMVLNEKNKYDYVTVEPCTPDNEDLPWEFEKDGKKYRRDKEMNFYVLPAKDAEKNDAFPLVLSFRRTSMKSGQKLANHFAKAAKNKVPPASMTVKVGCKTEKNDQGTYYVYTIDEGTKTSPAALGNAYEWYQRIRKGETKVAETNDEEAAPSQPAATNGAHQF